MYGFFKNKRIVLYDTLVEQCQEEEVTAVLAHELGESSLSQTWLTKTCCALLCWGGVGWAALCCAGLDCVVLCWSGLSHGHAAACHPVPLLRHTMLYCSDPGTAEFC